MPLFTRAPTRLTDLPSLTSSRPSRPRPTPTSTPPLSSTSHTSTTSSSGPSTPPATDFEPDASPSLVSTHPLQLELDGGRASLAPLPAPAPGHKLRTTRSRSKSRSREAAGGGDDDERAGRVGRFFRRIASRKSLRGGGGGCEQEHEQGREGEGDKFAPAVPSLPPRLEPLDLPSLGAPFELSGPVPPLEGPPDAHQQAGTEHEHEHEHEGDRSALAPVVTAAAGPTLASCSPAAHPPPQPARAQPAALASSFSRLKVRLSRLALPSSLSEARTSRPASVDAYGEASDDDNDEGDDDEGEGSKGGHAWLSAPPPRPAAAAAAATLLLTPPASPLYCAPPPPASPFLVARDYDPTVERLFAHARARLAGPAPSLVPSLALSSSSALALPPHIPHALPGPASTHPLAAAAAATAAGAAGGARHPARRPANGLRTLVAHRALRLKLVRGVTRTDRAELARTSSGPHVPPPPQVAPPHVALPLPRLREWAARPPFPERVLVHTASGGSGGTDVVRARLRSEGDGWGREGLERGWSRGTRAWLEAMAMAEVEGAGGHAVAGREREREGAAAAARRPPREAPPPPRSGGRGPSSSSSPSPVGPWLVGAAAVSDYGSRALPPLPALSPPPTRTPLVPGPGPGPGPGPLLLRQLARQDAEARLTGSRPGGGEEEEKEERVVEVEDEDEDERPLATLPRSPQRASRLLPPAALGPPRPASPRSRSRPTTPTAPSTAQLALLAAEQRKTARLEAELGRLRAREACRRREEDAAREGERARRRAEEQRRRTRAMHATGEARRRSTTTPGPGPGPAAAAAAAPQLVHSRSCGAYLAVPHQGYGDAWGAPPGQGRGLEPPLYHQPMHALSAPDLQALQRQQGLVRPLVPQQPQRYSLAPPPPSPSPSGIPLAPTRPSRPQRNSLRPSPHILPHSRSTPDMALSSAPAPASSGRSGLLAPPPPFSPTRRASYRPQTPLVTLEAA
ncbi:uncharacterized protein RHOBADRAFT_55940 [Rhodotorula graminis WP1]|uniref:Uncharacterized protein n=1 Tax=Rhodotorula graminis (strain WP1) TaxID=578459 RepID=A0A0P9GHP7_RHOGW|nr:uncharacterized protein RHOBADRAFT_55940 [Rhodotorula graminis WP1]KPV72480.1 hypothetical protein RHOBADRAFT_55940 [Rhodotorula graminis WP1]